jgi:antirestriction protein ArdC
MTNTSDIYQEVTDKIVTALETGTAPWLRPWKSGVGTALVPHNAVTGRAYNGINWLVLACAAYTSTGWLTYKQAQDLGGNVRKGEKGTRIVFWSFPKMEDKETGKEKVVPFAKPYTVFNLDQCEGLDVAKLKTFTPAVAGDSPINDIAARHNVRLNHGGDKAFFSPMSDSIGMPSADAFTTPAHYASTLAHELVHWTGHEARLARTFGKRFGDDAYAFEELVAEIGSAFVCATTGIALDNLQHADYVGSWLKVLKADKRAIFTASSQAKKAAEFLTAQEEADEVAIAA